MQFRSSAVAVAIAVPVVWRSEDLAAWTRTELHARGDVVAAGSNLLVAGPGSDGALMWQSDDDGRSWVPVSAQEVDGGEGLVLSDMAAGNGVVVAVGSSQEDMQGFGILSSTDDGGSWVRTPVDENTIEYTIEGGEVIGVYEPSDEQPPGCM